MSKCKTCNLKKIDKILFYDLTVQKCKTCKFIRIFLDDFDIIIYKTLLKRNIGNIKKYNDIFECNKYEKKIIEDFLQSFKKINDEQIFIENVCDVCKERLKKKKIFNAFEYFYCDYCKSIYFLIDDYENFINFLNKYIERKNLFFKKYIITCNKIKLKYLKLKEIFHRRMKNNVKK